LASGPWALGPQGPEAPRRSVLRPEGRCKVPGNQRNSSWEKGSGKSSTETPGPRRADSGSDTHFGVQGPGRALCQTGYSVVCSRGGWPKRSAELSRNYSGTEQSETSGRV